MTTKENLISEIEIKARELNILQLKQRLHAIVERCDSVQTLMDMEDCMKELYDRYAKTWDNVAKRDNICGMASQLCDTYNYKFLKDINYFMYCLNIDNPDVDTEHLYTDGSMLRVREKNLKG